MTTMYKEINVWHRKDDKSLFCFRCFELIPNGGFCVQSADIYSIDTSANNELDFKRQFIELLFEDPPEVRSALFPTLYEAIQAHIHEFEDL